MKVYALRVEENGNSCIFDSLKECCEMAEEEEMEIGDKLIISCEEMTEEEFNNMGEFDGW